MDSNREVIEKLKNLFLFFFKEALKFYRNEVSLIIWNGNVGKSL